jgi:hypothetical protein
MEFSNYTIFVNECGGHHTERTCYFLRDQGGANKLIHVLVEANNL